LLPPLLEAHTRAGCAVGLQVAFKLFGLIPGYVGLRGKLVPEGGDKDTVRVLFEPPVLSLLGMLHLRIGPPSSVVLATT